MRWTSWGVGLLWLLGTGAGLLGAGCERVPAAPAEGQAPSAEGVTSLALQSPAFAWGERIPVRYTCDGADISPPLAWQGAPEGTQAFVLVMDDPDAPGGLWVHWVLYDLPAEVRALPEGVQGVGVLGRNSWGREAYGGPCPPPGPAHRYFFRLYALDAWLGLAPGATLEMVSWEMEGHVLAQVARFGVYGR